MERVVNRRKRGNVYYLCLFFVIIVLMIRHILFDLDNTLYSARYGLDQEVTQRIREYTVAWLGLPPEEAERLREEGYRKYGTTVDWLVHDRNFTAIDEYQAFIHPEKEADTLLPDPGLRRFLESLPCPCSILTNSPRFHADRILKKLELEGIFKNIFDILGNGLRGKPSASVFCHALETLSLKPEEVLFVDDTPRYVEGYLALGGRGLLLDEMGIYSDYPHERIRKLEELVKYLN